MIGKVLEDANTLEEAVGMAIGAASVCWQDLSNAGIYNDTMACEIVEELVTWIRNRVAYQPTQDLPGELTSLLNRYTAENVSGTPDFILSEYLLDCVKAFNSAVVKRADWRGESTELPALLSLVNSDD